MCYLCHIDKYLLQEYANKCKLGEPLENMQTQLALSEVLGAEPINAKPQFFSSVSKVY